MFDKLIKRLLISRIKYPEVPKTKGDILRYALYIYLRGVYDGLCPAVAHAIERYRCKQYIMVYNPFEISQTFPLFRKCIAIRLFNGRTGIYWWPVKDWRNRYRFMKWLIKKYNNVEL